MVPVSSCVLLCRFQVTFLVLFFRYLATASSDHTVKIWNVDGFKLERTLVGNVQSLPLTNSPSQILLMFPK